VLEDRRRLDEAVSRALDGGGNSLGFFGKYDDHSWWHVETDLEGEHTIEKLRSLPDQGVAPLFSALGHEVRLAILRSLLHSPKNAVELVAELRLGTTGQAYHHVRELERAGYVEQREGRYHFVPRFIRVYLTALALAADVGVGSPKEANDPVERELAQAKQAAVTVIGHRNEIRGALEKQQKRAARIGSEARTALEQGHADLARQILIEKEIVDGATASLVQLLEQVEQNAAAVKESIRELDFEVRRRKSERLVHGCQTKSEECAELAEGVPHDQVAERQRAAVGEQADGEKTGLAGADSL
jgi:DNA-binding transcriptional ArsR family regulator